ncbi:dihydroorotate dehydrogenase-like protein [Candidatus Gracilibacteria bacterium]|nr:dihydroorotate dehydrogenase-like protein [Candidatus Gracilibacteria bacterium]
MVDLSTSYLGLSLPNPLVAAASPLSKKLPALQRLEEAGIAAVVMYSLFQETIEDGPENPGSARYLAQLQQLKEHLSIPVIASMNVTTPGYWVEYARDLQSAGADAIELNLYYLPTDLALRGALVEQTYVEIVAAVRERISVPLAVKLSPFVTALPNLALQLAEVGANGLVLFNRFYQPDFDVETGQSIANLHLSESYEMRLPLRWIALLSGRLPLDFALSTGVHTANDVLKATMVGARVSQLASALLNDGAQRVQNILSDMRAWLIDNEYQSLQQCYGRMAVGTAADQDERAAYSTRPRLLYK